MFSDSFPDNIALIDDSDRAMWYDELEERASSLYARIGRRCLVFLLASNTVGSVLGYFSFLKNRIVPVMLSCRLDPVLLNSLIKLYRPAYLWLPSEQVSGWNIVYSDCGYSLAATDMDSDCELYAELALLLTTSGSTGSPRFVRQSYANIEANTSSIIEYLSINSDERAITVLPMNYTYGLSVINTHLSTGATVLLTDSSVMQADFWTFFKEYGATSFSGVPYTYSMLDRLRFYKMNLPRLRTLTQAGGKLPERLQEKFAICARKKKRKFFVMYGQCEATARMSFLPSDRAVDKIGSIGIPVPGGRFRLIDSKGCEIRWPDTEGELVYEGANVTLGYAESASDLAKGDERGGILFTGDMGKFDSEGYYYITGRKKRFLKIFGSRINPDEVEDLVRSRFSVEVACAGVDDHMYIFLTDQDLSGNVGTFVAETTGINPSAFKTVVIPQIPKNDAGKIQYAQLAEYYEL